MKKKPAPQVALFEAPAQRPGRSPFNAATGALLGVVLPPALLSVSGLVDRLVAYVAARSDEGDVITKRAVRGWVRLLLAHPGREVEIVNRSIYAGWVGLHAPPAQRAETTQAAPPSASALEQLRKRKGYQ